MSFRPSGPGPDRERQRDDAGGRALAYARSIWSETVQAGDVDAVRRYLARRWCWPPEIALPDCVHWLSVPAARIASRRLPAGPAGALVFRFDVDARTLAADAQALTAVQLEALAPDGQRMTAWPSSSCTREAKRLTHGRLRGAWLQLPAPEATALALAVLVSYEDSPARIGARLHWFTETPPERLHLYGQPRSRCFGRTLKTAAP